MPITPGLEKLRQENCYKFKASLFIKNIMNDKRKCEAEREQIIESESLCIINNMAVKIFLDIYTYLISKQNYK